MSDVRSWDDRLADFLERVMAAAVVGDDPKPLQEELSRLLKEAPRGRLGELKLLEKLEKDDDGKPPGKPKPAKR